MDLFAKLYDPALLSRSDGLYKDGLFVDVGYGAHPFTVLESAYHLRQLNPDLPVLGVEIDPARVEEARPYATDSIQFRLGGFNVPLEPGETVRLIRAFNVLRQYDETAVSESHQQMGSNLLPDGLLIEGTSTPFGDLWVANVLRRKNDRVDLEALAFSTNFRTEFEPSLLQPVLPKNFIHRMTPDEPIFVFMEGWKRAYQQALPHRQWGDKQLFRATAENLATAGFPVETHRKWLGKGFLIWYQQ